MRGEADSPGAAVEHALSGRERTGGAGGGGREIDSRRAGGEAAGRQRSFEDSARTVPSPTSISAMELATLPEESEPAVSRRAPRRGRSGDPVFGGAGGGQGTESSRSAWEPGLEESPGARVGRRRDALSPPLAAGGESAFSNLYRSDHDRLVRLAYLLTSSVEGAEDIVQDSFVQLHRHFGHLDNPQAYLRRIVVNACHSYHRRRGRERERTALLHVVEETTDHRRVELADVLMDLPYRQRAAVVLRYYHDLSESEIAAILHCRPGTVGSLIHRGLGQLRTVVEK